MSETTNLGITKLEVGQAQKEATINEALDTLDALFGAGSGSWSSWTPTWTNLTVGNGAVTAAFSQIGKIVVCRLKVVLGSTSSVGSSVSFTLPVTKKAYGGTVSKTPIGQCRLFDTSAPVTVEGTIIATSTTEGYITVDMTNGTYRTLADLTSSVPFTWATGDEIGAQFCYEAA